jgi:hypothetical protein
MRKYLCVSNNCRIFASEKGTNNKLNPKTRKGTEIMTTTTSTTRFENYRITSFVDGKRNGSFKVHYSNLDTWCEEKKKFLVDTYHFDDVRFIIAVNGTLLMVGHREAKGRLKAKEVIFEIPSKPNAK